MKTHLLSASSTIVAGVSVVAAGNLKGRVTALKEDGWVGTLKGTGTFQAVASDVFADRGVVPAINAVPIPRSARSGPTRQAVRWAVAD